MGTIKHIKVNGTSHDINDSRIDAIDSTLSTSSDNPVENSTITDEFGLVTYLGEEDGTTTDPDFDAATDTVWTKAQTLSSAQQAQARANIGIPTNVSSFTNDANYVKYVLCADETAYNAITTKDSGTLYLIPES